MTIASTVCPSCKVRLKLPARDLGGKKVRCPRCKNTFRNESVQEPLVEVADNKLCVRCQTCRAKLVIRHAVNRKQFKCPKCQAVNALTFIKSIPADLTTVQGPRRARIASAGSTNETAPHGSGRSLAETIDEMPPVRARDVAAADALAVSRNAAKFPATRSHTEDEKNVSASRLPKLLVVLGVLLAPIIVYIAMAHLQSPRKGAVEGRVTFRGRPLVAGSVVLVGPDGSPINGALRGDGTYSVSGVHYGSVAIAVHSRNPAARGLPRRVEPGLKGVAIADEPQHTQGWFPIPEHYGDVTKSGLSLTVNQATTRHDIELK